MGLYFTKRQHFYELQKRIFWWSMRMSYRTVNGYAFRVKNYFRNIRFLNWWPKFFKFDILIQIFLAKISNQLSRKKRNIFLGWKIVCRSNTWPSNCYLSGPGFVYFAKYYNDTHYFWFKCFAIFWKFFDNFNWKCFFFENDF